MGSIWDPHGTHHGLTHHKPTNDIPYGSHMGPTWAPPGLKWAAHVGPRWRPRTNPAGSHMGYPHGAHLVAHLEPMWDPPGHADRDGSLIIGATRKIRKLGPPKKVV